MTYPGPYSLPSFAVMNSISRQLKHHVTESLQRIAVCTRMFTRSLYNELAFALIQTTKKSDNNSSNKIAQSKISVESCFHLYGSLFISLNKWSKYHKPCEMRLENMTVRVVKGGGKCYLCNCNTYMYDYDLTPHYSNRFPPSNFVSLETEESPVAYL